MFELFLSAFSSTFYSMLKISFIILIAGLLIHKKVISRETIKELANATVDVFLPCMIFSNIIKNFKPDEFAIWWVLPVSAVIITFIGIALGALFFRKSLPKQRNMLALTSFQNAGFLILPLGAILLPEQFEEFSLLVFLYLLAQSPMIWSLGRYLLAEPSTEGSPNGKGWITPPLLATLSSLLLVFTGLRDLLFISDSFGTMGRIFQMFLEAVEMLGQATVPVAMFVLGGMLGGIKVAFWPYRHDTIRVVGVKLILVPLVVAGLLIVSGLGKTYPLIAIFCIMQGASAPAASLALQIKKYGGDELKTGSILFWCYLLNLISLPFWVATWKWLVP